MNIKKFEVGKLYKSRTGQNQPSAMTLKAVNRTEKTVTFSDGKTFSLALDNGIEFVRSFSGSTFSRVFSAADQVG